jgi:predicted ArsR family transcriptional regulator
MCASGVFRSVSGEMAVGFSSRASPILWMNNIRYIYLRGQRDEKGLRCMAQNGHETGQPHRGQRNRQRQRVLELVREHDGPVDAGELAMRMGLHITTVRFHLDALCDDGVVERTRLRRAGVGRPRTGYLAVRERLDYRILSEILALELGDTSEKRRRRAEVAGRRWADRITANWALETGAARPRGRLEDRAAMVTTVFAKMGFDPELTPAVGTQQTIRLHACPVRDLARAHPEVGCAVHRGLLQGLLTDKANIEDRTKTSSSPLWEVELEPFVESELCIARVTAHD